MTSDHISASQARRHFVDDFVLCRRLLTARREEHARRLPNLACFAFDTVSAEVMVFGRFERALLERTFAFLDPFRSWFRESCAIDVGANIGNHSIYFSEFFSTVYAVEASVRTFDLLSFNSKYFGSGVVVPIRAALGDARRMVSFEERHDEVGCSGVIEGPAKHAASQITTMMLDIGDDLVAKHAVQGTVALIKIDVEGFEREVVMGFESTINRDAPVIIIEQLSPQIKNGTTDTIEYLRKFHGYVDFYHAETRRHHRNRYLNIARRLLFGDDVSFKKLTTLDSSTNYPLIVCLTPAHLEILGQDSA